MTERQSKLIKLLNLYQKIEVSRLAELLDVSQVTIRKDLDHLEEEGLLSREHGYALIKNANDINTRLTINYDKKIEIATKADEMVSNGETVMLESGSTCTLLAEQLAKFIYLAAHNEQMESMNFIDILNDPVVCDFIL